MGDGYTKLFSDIVDSSIWDEDNDTRIVWVTLLALSNADGFVRGSTGWLAGKSRVPVRKCAEALVKFAAPDPKSRTPDNDGRRIEVLEDGWLILNYLAFRDRLSTNPQAVKTRERVRKHRERYTALRNACNVTPPHSASASVQGTGKRGAGGKGNGFQKPTMPEMELHASKIGLPATEITNFFNYYEANGWRVGRNPMKSWQAAMVNWKNNMHRYGTKTNGITRPANNARNAGVTKGPNNFGDAARAKLARQAQVARPMDGNDIAPP